MKLYIGNATKQVQDFMFRMLESPKLMSQRIAIGSQIAISGDLSTPDIDYIIQQHGHYGLVESSSISRNNKTFTGLCYSIDKPITEVALHYLVSQNMEILTERGNTMRKEAVVAESARFENTIDRPLQTFEVSTVEETPSDSPVSEGLRVVKHSSEKPKGRRKK